LGEAVSPRRHRPGWVQGDPDRAPEKAHHREQRTSSPAPTPTAPPTHGADRDAPPAARLRPSRIRQEEGGAGALRRISSNLSTGRHRPTARPRGRSSTLALGTSQQRSLVKVSFAQAGKPGRWRAHGQYLSRPGAQRPGARSVGFDAEREEVHLPDRLGGWQKAGDARLWKMVVSPEAGGRVDLRDHARSLVAQMEVDLGTRLEWAAIDHHDTAHPHVHIAIRGVDAAGRRLDLPRDYVQRGIRARSQELLTRSLGPRLDLDRRQARERSVQAPRVTEIDRALRRQASAEGVIALASPAPPHPAAQERRLQDLRRLAYLEGFGLAERMGDRSWRLSDHLEAGLRQIQLSADIQKSLASAGIGITDRHAPVVGTRLLPGAELRGRVAAAAFDESRDQPLLILEGTDGLRHVMAQSAGIQRLRGEGRLRPGQVVTVRAWARPGAGSVTIQEHGTLRNLRQVDSPSTPLDLDAIASVRASGRLPDPAPGSQGFLRRWWEAVRARGPLLERAGLIRQAGRDHDHEAFEAIRGAELMVEANMRERERTPLSLEEVRSRFGKPLRMAEPVAGRVHRGRLVGYGEDADGARYAVLDTGRELTAIPTTDAGAIGHDVRARALLAAEEEREQRRVRWALDDLERSRQRGRGR
jgi:type IV secretory pathway VirD2 relaxase